MLEEKEHRHGTQVIQPLCHFPAVYPGEVIESQCSRQQAECYEDEGALWSVQGLGHIECELLLPSHGDQGKILAGGRSLA